MPPPLTPQIMAEMWFTKKKKYMLTRIEVSGSPELDRIVICVCSRYRNRHRWFPYTLPFQLTKFSNKTGLTLQQIIFLSRSSNRIKSKHVAKEKKAVFTNLHFIFKYHWNKSLEWSTKLSSIKIVLKKDTSWIIRCTDNPNCI